MTLGHDCRSALEAHGLDPQVGFLHADKPGRASLALDLMEELRPVLADRLALSLVNPRAGAWIETTTATTGSRTGLGRRQKRRPPCGGVDRNMPNEDSE